MANSRQSALSTRPCLKETGELPVSFQPTEQNVICGKGKKCYDHSGNKRFRKIVSEYTEEYSEAKTKLDKSIIVSRINNTVRSQSQDRIGFVKFNRVTGRWHLVDDSFAERIGQTIRDCLHQQYRSSSKAKSKRRDRKRQTSKSECLTYTGCIERNIAFNSNRLEMIASSTDSDFQLEKQLTNANLDMLNELNNPVAGDVNDNNADASTDNKLEEKVMQADTDPKSFDIQSEVSYLKHLPEPNISMSKFRQTQRVNIIVPPKPNEGVTDRIVAVEVEVDEANDSYQYGDLNIMSI